MMAEHMKMMTDHMTMMRQMHSQINATRQHDAEPVVPHEEVLPDQEWQPEDACAPN